MIENSVMIGLIFSVLSALVLPLGMFVYCIFSKKKILKPFIVGVFVFFISQMVLRIPIISYILPNQIWYIKLSTNPYLYGIFLGITAGIFEEVGRYIGFKYFLKKKHRYIDGISFGLGHWGIEALLIVGINAALFLGGTIAIKSGVDYNSSDLLSIIFNQSSSMTTVNAFAMGVERLFTMSIHVALSMIVLYGVKSKKIKYLFIAILIHGMIDAGVVILPQIFNLSIVSMEIYVFIWSLVFLYLILKIKDLYKNIDDLKYEKQI